MKFIILVAVFGAALAVLVSGAPESSVNTQGGKTMEDWRKLFDFKSKTGVGAAKDDAACEAYVNEKCENQMNSCLGLCYLSCQTDQSCYPCCIKNTCSTYPFNDYDLCKCASASPACTESDYYKNYCTTEGCPT